MDGGAGREPALQSLQIRVGDLFVAAHAEEQRDVDVDPLVERLLDRGQADLGRRDLDHHVRTVDRSVQMARVSQRRLGVVRQVGRDLEAHEAVSALGPVVDPPQDVARGLHVLDGDRLVDLTGAQPARGELLDPLVVAVLAGEGLVEDGRVRRDPAEPLLLDPSRQLAVTELRAGEVVEPEALALLTKLQEWIRLHCRSALLRSGVRMRGAAWRGPRRRRPPA